MRNNYIAQLPSYLRLLAGLCFFLFFVFVFTFCVGAGFYFGAARGGWMPTQEVHCENANLFPGECVITELSSGGTK